MYRIGNYISGIRKERVEYNKNSEKKRKNRISEKYTVEDVFDGVVVEMKTDKYALLKCNVEVLYNHVWSEVRNLVRQKNKKEELKSKVRLAKMLYRWKHIWKGYSYLDKVLGVWGIKNHVYTEAYGEIKKHMRKSSKNTVDKMVKKVTEFLYKLHQNVELPSDSSKIQERVYELYKNLEEKYGNVINVDILIFFYVVYYMDWKKIRNGLDDEFSILCEIFPEPETATSESYSGLDKGRIIYEMVMKNNVCLIYSFFLEKMNDTVENRKKVYIKVYNLVCEILNKKWTNRSLDEVRGDKCFLMTMYSEVICRCKCIASPSSFEKTIKKNMPFAVEANELQQREYIHQVLEQQKKDIKNDALPLFCELFCDIKKYQKNKMISLMLEVTNNSLLDVNAVQEDRIRYSYTKEIQRYYKLMLYNAKLLKENADGNIPTERIRKKCEKLIYKEFKEAKIPEWNINKGLSDVAKRCNCMMMIAVYIMCNGYECCSDVYMLAYWLNEINEMYEKRKRDRTFKDEIINNMHFEWTILSRLYLELISNEFVGRLLDMKDRKKALKKISYVIWGFQVKPVEAEDMGEIFRTISQEYWEDDIIPWFQDIKD